MIELVWKCFLLSVSRIEGQLILILFNTHFLCNCGKQPAFMVSRTLFSYFRSDCFIISSGGKRIVRSKTTGERSEGSTSLSRHNIKNNISVCNYRRLDF